MIVLSNQCHPIIKYEKLAHFQLENPIDFQYNKRKPIEEHQIANVIFQLISKTLFDSRYIEITSTAVRFITLSKKQRYFEETRESWSLEHKPIGSLRICI